MSEILTVSQLTEKIRDSLEKRFPFVWVSGEVTNLARPGSGHVYFSLRHGEDLLNCVWFRGKQKQSRTVDEFTGEVFEDGPRPCLSKTMRDGDKIACGGTLSVYGPRGAYQMLVENALETGQGDLLRQLERLKRELAAKGWFAQDRKRPLPVAPTRVAVVTAPTGAAIRDFLRIAAERGTGAEIRIVTVPVQGAEAAPKIVRAINKVNEEGWAEVIVLIRGGGSLEDLWAFNDPGLAEAIVHSRLPVITGIGHEVDTSVADLAADCRAATPSHVAQILWQERHWYAQRVDAAAMALNRAMVRRLETIDGRLAHFRRALDWLSPEKRLTRAEERFALGHRHLHEAMARRLQHAEGQTTRAIETFLRLSPERRFTRLQATLASHARELNASALRRLETLGHRLSGAEARLTGLNPHAPLQRGYALVRAADGTFLRRAADTAPGAALRLCLRDGEVSTTVTKVHMKDTDHA